MARRARAVPRTRPLRLRPGVLEGDAARVPRRRPGRAPSTPAPPTSSRPTAPSKRSATRSSASTAARPSRSWASTRASFYTPAYQKLTLNEARVHKADGRIIDVEPRHAQLRDLVTDYQVYDRDKQLIISFPTLETGDVIEVKWTVRGRNPEHQGQFFTRYTFGDDHYPVVRRRVPRPRSRRGPSSSTRASQRQARRRQGDGVRATTTTTYVWAARTATGLPQDYDLPSNARNCGLKVGVSTFASWDEVAAWKRRLRSDAGPAPRRSADRRPT